jgi:hypothetical protein
MAAAEIYCRRSADIVRLGRAEKCWCGKPARWARCGRINSVGCDTCALRNGWVYRETVADQPVTYRK